MTKYLSPARYLSPLGWIVLASLAFWVLVAGVCVARANSLTFDCTPPGDAITSAKIQFNSEAPIDVPLTNTCGTDPATKVTCTDPASKTICYPDSFWPAGAFAAKAQVINSRTSSGFSVPLSVPAVPGSPSSLRSVR